MKKYIPDYYKEFQCIAGECKDNCCIGWDIMIDEESYKEYQAVKTPFKARLDQGICHGEEPHFRLDAKKRCAFLNDQNLCDIYMELGEDALCEICTQHPRFHNEYGHILQSGLGIACEEAARLILEEADFHLEEVCSKEGDFDEWAEELMQIEIRLLNLLNKKELLIDERINQVYDLTAAYQEQFNLTGELSRDLIKKEIPSNHILKKMQQKEYLKDWFDFYENLDYMDEDFYEIVKKSKESVSDVILQSDENVSYIERLISYFIYRHFIKSYEDDNFLGKIKFAILSCLMIECMNAYCKKQKLTFDRIDIAKMYSKEIEYSEENMDEIYEELLFE